MEALIMNLLGGAVGGNLVGGLLKKLSLGTLLNSVVGILGGGLGGQLLKGLNVFQGLGINTGTTFSVENIAGQVLGSGVGGGVLLGIVGLIKNGMKKKK